MSYINRLLGFSEKKFRLNNETPRRYEFTLNHCVYFEYMKEHGNMVLTDHDAGTALDADGIFGRYYVSTVYYPAIGELTISVMQPGIMPKTIHSETFNTNMQEDEAFQFSVVPHLFNTTPENIKGIVKTIEQLDEQLRKPLCSNKT